LCTFVNETMKYGDDDDSGITRYLSAKGLRPVSKIPSYGLFNYECLDKKGRRVYVVLRRSGGGPFVISPQKIRRLSQLNGSVYFLMVRRGEGMMFVKMSALTGRPEAYRKRGVYVVDYPTRKEPRFSVPRRGRTVLRIWCNEEMKRRFNVLKASLGLTSEGLLRQAIDMYERYTKPLQRPTQTVL